MAQRPDGSRTANGQVEALGPTGARVAARLKQVRQERGLTLAQLAARLEALGRPLLLSALSKIEQRQRRVDADDLVALARALDVSPMLLLLPADASADTLVQLTESDSVDASRAWQWMTLHIPVHPEMQQARSGYLEQVRRIAPVKLIGREAELGELASFCLGPDNGSYAWWQAGPWAGKTALLSAFVLHPPAEVAERVRIVSFFITARLAAQDTRDAFTYVVLEQLAALLGQPLPSVLAEATREAYLLDLLSQAAAACEEAGERLVLVVDGLDEDRGVTTGPGAHSIAGLLPAAPPSGMRVIVAGRPNPPVPADVPDWHPLRDPAIIRPLAVSGHAGDIGRLAERELGRLVSGSMTERDVLGFLTAAPSGLNSRDLADLAGAPLGEVEDILRAVTGRTFTSRPDSSGGGESPKVYLMAHEELQAQASAYLGIQLQGYRDRLQTWVDGYSDHEWVPEYAELLRRLRHRAGTTQEELAAAAGVSPRTVSDLERGINLTPRWATTELLADALLLTGPEREQFMAAARGRSARRAAAQYAVSVGASVSDDDADASNVVWIESAASPAFVGREEELGVLREAWSGAKAGRRVLTLVGGEPGIGKTALTAELARLVHSDGGLVLYGRWDEHVLTPYQGIREALDDYARACSDGLLREDLAGLAEEIARLCPEPARRVGASAAPPQAAAEAERFRLFESLDTWIRRIAGRHPVLLVLDDLQWADQPSLFLLQHLMRARRSTPLLTVAMYRDIGTARSELARALPSLSRDIDCRRVLLRGLERPAVTALLEDAVGRPFGERESVMVTQLEFETAGNPFFVLEMANQLSEAGAFDRDVVRLGEMSAEIPQSVRDMVRSRLRRLSDRCVETLAIASLIGERFDAALLASAASLADVATVDALEEAARAGLITETDDEPDCWRFSHSLTRRVTSEELSRGHRALLHQRIGETLESRPGVSPAELAHHFGAAASRGSAQQAVRYGRLAGQRALREVAAEVAVRHFRRALELLDRFGPQDQALRCELLLDLAGAHDRAGEYASRDERFAEAAEVARGLGSGGLFARAALGYGGILPAAVRPDPRAQALLEEALKRLGEEDDAARATILARLAHWLHNVRRYPERLELSDRSVTMARRAGDPRTLATVLLHRCWALDGPDDVGDALTIATEILGIGAELGDPELTFEGLRIRLAAQFESGAHSAALQTAHDLKALAEEVRHPEFIRLSAMWDIAVASLEGRFKEGEELAGELGRRLDQIDHPQARRIATAQSASWRLLQGHATEYITLFEALSVAEPGNLAWPAITAWSLAESGARDRAADLLRQTEPASAADADKNYLWWAVIVGFSAAVDLVEDRRWAEALYDLAAPYAGSNCTLGVASFLGAADHWLGVLAAAARRFTEAVAHLEAALARHREMGARPWIALTEEAYGHVLSMRGQAADAEQAARLSESAMRTAEELGLAAITNRLRLRG